MSATDNRIVKMVFDNDLFKKKASETKQSLTEVNSAIDAAGKNKSLMGLDSTFKRVQVTASKMSIVVGTALATITNKVVNAGLNMAKSLTLDPIKQGFHEYESLLTKQNVIMNATGASATKVKSILNQLNHYSDKTVYSFGNMTDAITKFTNAGVPLDKAVVSIKGIANAAAFAGASSEEANRAMYAFSQSMSLGFVQLQDWNQIENANMGTVQFKQTLIDAGVAAGTLTKRGKEFITSSGKAITATKGWRDGLQDQWATTEVLNTALGKYADQSTKLGKKAFQAATQVRTFSAFMDTLKESIGSGWSQIFTALFGGLNEATHMWTGLSNSVGGAVKSFFNFAASAIKTWRTMGGFQKTLQGFQNILAPIGALFKTVGAAWNEAFPTTGKGAGGVLYSISSGFEAMTRPLAWLATQIPKLTPVFAFFFKIVKMGVTDVSGLASYLIQLVEAFGKFAEMKGPSSGAFSDFFDAIGKAVSGLVQKGKDAAKQFLDGIKAGFTNGSVDTTATLIGTGLIGGILLTIRKIMKKGLDIDLTGGLTDSIKGTFGALTGSLSAMQTNLKVKTLLSIAAAVGILAASVVALSFVDGKKLATSLGAVATGLALLMGGMFLLTKMAGAGGFIKLPLIASGLVLLAGAVAILSASLIALSFLSWEDIGKGLSTIAVMIASIGTAMKLVPKTLPVTAAGLVLVGGALVLIAGAIAILSAISWEGIAKGVVAITGAIAGIAVAMKLMPKSLPITAAGLVLVGGALNLIGLAILAMSSLSWEQIAKGVTAISAAIAGIAVAMKLMPKSLPLTAAGLVLVGVALNGIAIALKSMGGMGWEEIAKGLVTLGGSLGLLAAGLNLMNGTLLGSAALGVAAASIMILAPALKILGSLSWEDIAQALVGLAGGLLVLGVAATAMGNPATLAGAAAMLIMAPAIAALAGALALLGQLDWGQLAVALVGLAAGLAVVVVAGYAMTPIVGTFLAFGAAMFLFGAGLKMAAEAIGIFVADVVQLVGAGKMVVAGFIGGIVSAASKIWDVLSGIFGKVITFVKNIFGIHSPSTVFSDIGGNIIQGLINGLKGAGGAVWGFLSGLFSGAISKAKGAVSGFISVGSSVISHVVSGIGSLASNVGGKIGEIISGALDKAKGMAGDFLSVGTNMVQGIIDGIGSMLGNATSAIGSLAGSMIDKAKGMFKIFSPSRVFRDIGKFLVKGLTNGITENASFAVRAVASMVSGQIAIASSYISKFVQDLDQQAIAARAKAQGLEDAAKRAAAAADKTKKKKDDKSAEKLQKSADKANNKADIAEKKASAAADKADRAEEFKQASALDKAKMKSEDAQNQLDAAKRSELAAARDRQAANSLVTQSKAKGVGDKEAKALLKQADDLRKKATEEAQNANKQIAAAKASASSALAWQKTAGKQAADAMSVAFKSAADQAKADADFEKMTTEEKASKRRQDAALLQAKADKDLAAAKKLAYTDLDKANELAQQAMDEAQKARDYLKEAQGYVDGAADSMKSDTPAGSTVVNIDPTEAASIAFNKYAEQYDAAAAAAAATPTVQFNQYNSSPDPLSPVEVYRQTNNQLAFAANKLVDAAA